MVETTYKKPTANVILTGVKLEVFPLSSDRRQGSPFTPLFFNIVLEVLSNNKVITGKKQLGKKT